MITTVKLINIFFSSHGYLCVCVCVHVCVCERERVQKEEKTFTLATTKFL